MTNTEIKVRQGNTYENNKGENIVHKSKEPVHRVQHKRKGALKILKLRLLKSETRKNSYMLRAWNCVCYYLMIEGVEEKSKLELEL